MTVAVRNPAGLKTIAEVAARNDANVLKTIAEGWIRTSAGLKQLFGQFLVALSRYDVAAHINSSMTVPVTSIAVTATVTGGSAPYTHAWTKTSGAAGWSIGTPAAASTSFTSPALGPGDVEVATFKDTGTDSAGHVLASADVTITARNIYGGFA